ncbi:IS1634 family transposase [Prevotella copri]|nr:IS1634 family transposase [Segatella copri]MBM0155551.1 IS1634 family transposase [Segatella copri]QNT66162.1 IS1634 family transposase [Segatella copri]
MCTFAPEMYISKAKKYRDQGDGTAIAYDYYRLTKSYIDKDGKTKHRSVLCLGELPGFDKDERNRLAAMLTTMIEDGQSVMCDNRKLYEEAMSQYVKYRGSKYAQENDPRLIAERKAREEEERKKAVAVKLETLTQHEARIIGCENLCNSTMRMLDIRKYLTSRGWKRDQINFALMQIIARAIYPYSELKTVRYLRENTALAEMFGIEEKILLFDITNSYFEEKMENSELCQYGRSKEKRDDCKIVVLAAVVNTEGLLVRTMIYEGNRHDSTTVEEVVGTLAKTTAQDAKRIVVMDAGFYSKSNVNWLKANGFDYITVLPSGDSKFESTSSEIIDHTDNKGQQIRLQMGKVDMDGESVKALMVDSDAKGAKERSMYEQACKRYEEGLEAIKKGILTKGGTKKRDAVNKRLGKFDKQYGAIRLSYNVTFTYEGTGKNEVATSMTWECREDKAAQRRKFHGKYVLLTSLDESQKLNIWKFYNVIRTVEETFHVLKTDLDIRPVYHKSDNGIKSHLNLAILVYWVVSVTKYRLKLKKHENVRWDEIMRIASTQVVVTAKVETVDG